MKALDDESFINEDAPVIYMVNHPCDPHHSQGLIGIRKNRGYQTDGPLGVG